MVRKLIGKIVWPLISRSSTVTFDIELGRVTKVYHPRFMVRVLHLLAFQRWKLPYEAETGLKIAAFRREIAQYILKTSNHANKCRVAEFLGISRKNQGVGFVTEYIEGESPLNQEAVGKLLSDLEHLFASAGLPTWSISTRNPRAYTNIIFENGDSSMPVVIDLEALLPGVPLHQLIDFAKVGIFPLFDDINFQRLKKYFLEVRCQFPANGQEFLECIDECEKLSHEQERKELRIFTRVLSLLRLFLSIMS